MKYVEKWHGGREKQVPRLAVAFALDCARNDTELVRGEAVLIATADQSAVLCSLDLRREPTIGGMTSP